MASEREVRKETTLWGGEKEVIYEDGTRVGEIRSEERGGFLGIGAETVRVERDNDGCEVAYEREEERGGILGIGGTPTQVRCSSDGSEISTSQIENRGGFLGIGSESVRVERDPDGNEIGETRWERRGSFLGLGGERVRVSTYAKASSSSTSQPIAGSGGNPAQGSSSFAGPVIVVAIIAVVGWLALEHGRRESTHQPAPPPAVSSSPVPPLPQKEVQADQPDPAVREVQHALTASGFDSGPADGLMGSQTRRAIRDFQLSRGEKATGVLTPSQRSDLIARGVAPSSPGHATGHVNPTNILPIEHGAYVSSQVACRDASNATIMWYDGLYFYAGRYFARANLPHCNISVRNEGNSLFSVTRNCNPAAVREYPWLSEAPRVVQQYRILSRTEFSVGSGGYWSRYRYCADSQLPADWR
ncbi:MAG: peptidoglycan-binding domain-containing protein [Defluviicoccus sp.]